MTRTHPEPPDRLTRRVLNVCDTVGAFIEYWGFKAIHGRIWALLALRTEPMSQMEISETLGVSRSLVSAAMHELSDRALVRPVSAHRNAPYEAVMDVWPTISDVLRSREWMLLESSRNAVEAALEEAELSDPDHSWRVERLELLLTMTELAQALLKMLIAIRLPKSAEGATQWVSRAATLIRSMRR